MIIIVFGLPGSGKSYFASRLATQLDSEYLNTDELRFKMFQQRTYSDVEKNAVYDAMLKIMNETVSRKKTIILDGTFYKNAIRRKFEEGARRSGEILLYIEVRTEEGIARERLEKTRANSEADYSVYQKIKASAEPLDKEHLILDSSNDNVDEMLQKSIAYIERFK